MWMMPEMFSNAAHSNAKHLNIDKFKSFGNFVYLLREKNVYGLLLGAWSCCFILSFKYIQRKAVLYLLFVFTLFGRYLVIT